MEQVSLPHSSIGKLKRPDRSLGRKIQQINILIQGQSLNTNYQPQRKHLLELDNIDPTIRNPRRLKAQLTTNLGPPQPKGPRRNIRPRTHKGYQHNAMVLNRPITDPNWWSRQ